MTEHLGDKHLDGVALLEQLCFASPWSRDSLGFLLQNGNFGIVSTLDGVPVSYVGLVRAADEGEITNVATHPDHRGKGHAKAALVALMTEAKERGILRITLEVRVSNEPALVLYRALGFLECGRRKNAYSLPREDAIIMECLL